MPPLIRARRSCEEARRALADAGADELAELAEALVLDAVEDAPPVAAPGDEARLGEAREVLRRVREGDAGAVREVADGQLPDLVQLAEQAQPRAVAEQREHPRDVFEERSRNDGHHRRRYQTVNRSRKCLSARGAACHLCGAMELVIEGYAWRVPATVRRVVDGDTVEVDLDLGWRVYRNREHLRILGLDAPERRTAAGAAAKAFAEQLLPAGLVVEVASQGKPTFTRTVGSIAIAGRGDFAALMIAAGHGRRRAP